MIYLLRKSVLLIVTTSVGLPTFTLIGILYLYQVFYQRLPSFLALIDYINLILRILGKFSVFLYMGWR